MFLATVLMTAGVSTWIIFGEISAGPNFLATTKKTPKINGGGVYYLNDEYKRFDTAENRAYDGGTVILEAGFLSVTDDEGNTVSGRFVFADNGVNTKQIEFTDCDVSELHTKKAETSTLLADKFQAFPSTVLLRFIPTDTTKYFSVEYTANVLSDVRDSNDAVVVPIYPVARIGTTFYGTVEKALTSVKANETVYVLPGANPTIRENCTIPSNTMLTLHINDDNGTYGSVNENNIRNFEHRTKVNSGLTTAQYGALRYGATKPDNFKTFADTDINNLVNEVTIDAGVTLTVNGTLNIGGVVGKVGQDLMGQTSGYYAQITMEDNAKIISNNIIDCLGFIKEKTTNNSGRVLVQYGTVYQPFVIYDYRGGNSTAGMYVNSSNISIMPFSQYDLPNIQSIMEIKSTANIVGYADLHTGYFEKEHSLFVDGKVVVEARHNCADVNVIGAENSIINVETGGYIISKYNAVDTLTAKSGTTTLDIYGGAANGTMELVAYIGINTKVGLSSAISYPLVIDEVPIDTKEVYFAVSWKYDISLNAGNYNFIDKIKLMTGAKLTVGSDATLNVNGELIIYETFTDSCTINKYPAKDPAQFIVDGTVNVSGAIAGEIIPGESEAMLNLSGSTALELQSNEGWGAFDMSGLGVNMETINVLRKGEYNILFKFTHSTGSPITETATGNVSTSDNALKNKKYTSNGSAWVAEVAMRTITANYNTSHVNTPTIKDGNGNSYNIGAEVADGTILTITVTAKSGYKITKLSVGADVDDDGDGVVTHTVDGNVVITVESEKTGGSNPCIVEGTLITLADGTKKAVENLTHEDKLLVFNHYTGEIETGYVAMLDHLEMERELRKVVNLEFSNGEVLRTVWAHGIFDCTLNEYVFITEENATDYVGHEFFATEYDGTKFIESKVTLVKAYVTEEEIKVYNPTSLWHMNYFASGILNVTAAPVVISGHVNYFELDENMKYDEQKMQEDIEKYGLYTYEDFAEYLTEEQFNALPFCYLKVSVGKGLITWDGILDIIEHIKKGNLM